MRLVLALLPALLAACAASPRVPPERVDVVWLRVADVQRTCQGLTGRTEFTRILGCSRWSAGNRRCEIYARAPRDERDLQAFVTLGHELMHCFDGRWHDRWGRMQARE